MTSALLRRHEVSRQDLPSAAALLEALDRARADDNAHLLLVDARGVSRRVEVPRSAMVAFKELVSLLVRDGSATLFAEDEEVSPEAAASIVGMSRPMVTYRLKQGDIPFRMVGTHHRIKVSDLLAFKARQDREEAALAELGEQTDEMTQAHGF